MNESPPVFGTTVFPLGPLPKRLIWNWGSKRAYLRLEKADMRWNKY